MCGIGGILFSKDQREVLEGKAKKINDVQRHRGPDGQFSVVLDQHVFCHQRLALLDTAGGQQPFRDTAGRYLIVYNGELYNYLELKETLSKFYQFITHSDTEVILAAYIIWGESCLDYFNGMFAFLIWDTQTSTAFAARDPLGVKPFVYSRSNSTFLFTSELKALLAIMEHHPEIDPSILAEYVIAPYLSGGGGSAVFKNIHYLEPGTSMRIDAKGIYINKYYQFTWKKTSLSQKELIRSLSEALKTSVELSLRADVPLGIFLSGGLDSSLIGAIAAQHSNKPQAAFSITFENHQNISFDPSSIVNSDDLPFAIELAGHLKVPFHPVMAQHHSLVSTCKQLAYINDRIPVWEQEFSQHFLARSAASLFKAVLVGDAADETHYGYFFLLNERITKNPLELLFLFGGHKRMPLLARQFRLPWEYFEDKYKRIAKEMGFDFDQRGEESLLAMSALISRCWLERLLHNGDIHTMHFGLEARVPFANRNLLDIACQISPRLGFSEGVEKYFLRQAAAKWLSPHFYNRKKSALPRDPRLGSAFQGVLRTLLQGKNDFIDTFLHRPELKAMCERRVIDESDRMILFNMISLINWAQYYVK